MQSEGGQGGEVNSRRMMAPGKETANKPTLPPLLQKSNCCSRCNERTKTATDTQNKPIQGWGEQKKKARRRGKWLDGLLKLRTYVPVRSGDSAIGRAARFPRWTAAAGCPV